MNGKKQIRCDDSLNPETKVYLIGRYLHENGKIDDDLWYSILELKDKHFCDIQIEYDYEYFQ